MVDEPDPEIYKREHYDDLLAQHQQENIKTIQGSMIYAWIFFAIDNDFLIYITLTSQAQGKKEALGLPFGVGKSTLMLWLMYSTYRILLENRKNTLIYTYEDRMKVWDLVFNYLWMRPKSLYEHFFVRPTDPAHYRYTQPRHIPQKLYVMEDGSVPILGIDDLQISVGKRWAHDTELQEVASSLTGGRHGHFKVCLGTCPQTAELMKGFRECFSQFELIIYDRGKYEFQKTHYSRRFDDWLRSKAKARYQSEGEFPDLPYSIEERYKKWHRREEQIIHRTRYSAWRQQKTLDQVLTPTAQGGDLQKRYDDLQKKFNDLQKNFNILADEEQATVGQKLSALRWRNKNA